MQAIPSPQEVHKVLDENNTLTVSAVANTAKAQPRRASTTVDAISVEDMAKHLFKSRILWHPSMDTIIIITKARDNRLVRYTRRLVEWLISTRRFGKEYPFTVYVDEHLKTSKLFKYQQLIQMNPVFQEKLKFWRPKLVYQDPSRFHLIVTLGGDGTVLFTSWLFQTIVPPIMSMNLGSLGFLTPFPFESCRETLSNLFEGDGFRNTVRMRLACTVYRYRPELSNRQKARQSSRTGDLWTKEDTSQEWELMETAWMRKQFKEEAKKIPESRRQELDRNIPCYTTVPCETIHVLNDIVIDRGPHSYMSMLELFGDERHLTTVQADGLCIATPTGSTAYSLSANGSLTHPAVRATLVTPICPHTLSFRSMLLPEDMTIRIVIPFSSRKSAFCSFDGRNKIELRQGDHVKIRASRYPVPTVCRTEPSNDWFTSLQESLQWNVRQRQKSFVVFESEEDKQQDGWPTSEVPQRQEDKLFACLGDEPRKPKRNAWQKASDDASSTTTNTTSTSSTAGSDDEEAFDDEREEEKFDLLPWSESELARTECNHRRPY